AGNETRKKNRDMPGFFPGCFWDRRQTISFRPFRAATLTVLEAGLALNIISSPVNGFTPLRALVAGFFTTRIFSRPGNVNRPLPLRPARLFLIWPESESKTEATCFL